MDLRYDYCHCKFEDTSKVAEFYLHYYNQCDVSFIDPPFNIGQDYLEYYDHQQADDYIRRVEGWVATAWMAVKPGGVLMMHLPDHLVGPYWRALGDISSNILGIARLHDWVVWHYRFGQHTQNARRFQPSKANCLIFRKEPGQPVFRLQDPAVQRETVRSQQFDIRDSGMPAPHFNVWGLEKNMGRVQGNNLERVSEAPNQLPELYVERLIRAYCPHGGKVCDGFCGSGTVVAVCKALERSCITYDVSYELLKKAQDRIAVRVPSCEGWKDNHADRS